MKLFGLSDVHIKEGPPRTRIDKYYETQFSKLEWCINLANEKKCELFLQAADLFHSAKASKASIRRVIQILNKCNSKILTVMGQHDSLYHAVKSIDNTPNGILEAANLITILNEEPYIVNNVHIYGSSFGEAIPAIQDPLAFNVLVIHRMIIKEKLWEGQEEYTKSSILLRQHDFDLIISGDNHNHFIDQFRNQYLFNLGSMMRMTSAQIDHEPCCCIFDTESRDYEIFKIPIEPPEKVFDLTKVEKEKIDSKEIEKIKEYINTLIKETECEDIQYVDNLNDFMDSNNINIDVKDIVLSTLED